MQPEYLQRCTVLLLIYLALNQNLHAQISPHMQYAIDAIWDNARRVHQEAANLRNQRNYNNNTYSSSNSFGFKKTKKYEPIKPAYEPYKPLPKEEKSEAEIVAENFAAKARKPVIPDYREIAYFYDSKNNMMMEGSFLGSVIGDAFPSYVSNAYKYLVLAVYKTDGYYPTYENRVYFVGAPNGVNYGILYKKVSQLEANDTWGLLKGINEEIRRAVATSKLKAQKFKDEKSAAMDKTKKLLIIHWFQCLTGKLTANTNGWRVTNFRSLVTTRYLSLGMPGKIRVKIGNYLLLT